MKSKLFLSLSLLTAVFSMSANVPMAAIRGDITGKLVPTSVIDHALPNSFLRTSCRKVTPYMQRFGYDKYTALAGALALPTVGAIASVAAVNYMQQPEVQLTRFERAKLALNNGYSIVKTNVLNGYNSSLKFVKANPKSTGAAAATVAVLGLGYAAYKNSDAIFGKSKAVTTVVETPKAPVFVTRKNLRD